MTSLKTRILTGVGSAAALTAIFSGVAAASAAPFAPLPQDWTKVQCVKRPTGKVGSINHCYSKTYPGERPADWDTPNYIPFACNPNGYWVVCIGNDPSVRHFVK